MKFDRDMGYFAVKLYFFTLMVVWGWRGNIYRSKRVLRFDFGQNAGVHRCKISFVTNVTSDLYIYRLFKPWRWICNSEHLAIRFGKQESGLCWEMTAWRSSLFGSHYYN